MTITKTTYNVPSFLATASAEEKSFFFYENAEKFAYDVFAETHYGNIDRPRMRRLAASSVAGRATIKMSIDEMLFSYAIHKALDLAVVSLKNDISPDTFYAKCYKTADDVLKTSDKGSYNFSVDFAEKITEVIGARYSAIAEA